MDEILKSAALLVVSVGGSGAILSGVAAFIAKWWIDKIYMRTQAKYEQELEEVRDRTAREMERLRSEIADRQRILNATHDALARSYGASHEKTLVALEALWGAILEIEKTCSPIIFVYGVWSSDEHRNVPVNEFGTLNQIFASYRGKEMDLLFQNAIIERVQPHRLFIGEKLWQLFVVYSTLSGKLAFKLLKHVNETEKIPEWDKDMAGKPDVGIMNALKIIFSGDELNAILTPNAIGVPQRVLGALEIKILNDMNEFIFGKRLVDTSIAEQQKLDSFYKENISLSKVPLKD